MDKTIEMEHRGIQLKVPASLIVDSVLERLGAKSSVQVVAGGIPPIGQLWVGQGGYFAGIARDENGGPDYALIVSPSEGDFGSLNWAAALTEAAAFKCEGHSDYASPTQRQIHLCYANVPELFQKEWYWSSTQYSVVTAWCQSFSTGHQSRLSKLSLSRVRAVRRASLVL